VIALAVVVIGLAAAYRMLGGAQPRAADAHALLSAAAARLRSSLTVLDAHLDDGSNAEESPATEPDRDSRRAGAAAAQLIDRLPGDEELDQQLVAARALLAAAAEDTTWAWRMAASAAGSPGLVAAVGALRDHALRCCDEAGALLAREPSAASVDLR
jgi:hypothetical protein